MYRQKEIYMYPALLMLWVFLFSCNNSNGPKDKQIVLLARDYAIKILKEDPKLLVSKNITIHNKLKEIMTRKGEWGRIS